MKKILLAAAVLSCRSKLNLNNISKGDEEDRATRAGQIKGTSWQGLLVHSAEYGSDKWCENILLLIDNGAITANRIQELKPLIEDIINKGDKTKIDFVKKVIKRSLNGNDLAKAQLLKLFNKTKSPEEEYNILHYASTFLDVEFVELLIRLGMDVNCVSKKGTTPLMLAASRQDKNVEVVQYLLEKKADTTKENSYGNRAIDLAISDEIEMLLKEKEAEEIEA